MTQAIHSAVSPVTCLDVVGTAIVAGGGGGVADKMFFCDFRMYLAGFGYARCGIDSGF